MEKGDFAPKNREAKKKQAYPAERSLLKSKEICGICLFWCRGFKNQYFPTAPLFEDSDLCAERAGYRCEGGMPAVSAACG